MSVTTWEITVKLGTAILCIVAVVCVGSFLAPFAAIIWALATFSLTSIIKGIMIAYVTMIPISFFADARKRQG